MTFAAARTAAEPWRHLERAHIVSQPWAWPHTRVHWAMLTCAIRQRDRRELVGQLVRLVVAGPGSLADRYPTGNTGRTTVRLTETAPVPADLEDPPGVATPTGRRDGAVGSDSGGQFWNIHLGVGDVELPSVETGSRCMRRAAARRATSRTTLSATATEVAP